MNYMIIENDNMKIQMKNPIIIYDLEPLLELHKGKLFSNILKVFINSCLEQFGTNIFSIKKSYSRTLTNILSGWMFSLYVDYDFSKDYFFPTNYNNVETLVTILKDMCKYDSTIKNVDNKIEQVILKLKSTYSNELNNMEKYKNSNLFNYNKSNYTISRTKYMNEKTNTVFYKLTITIDYIIKDKRLLNILNNIIIPVPIYNRLEAKYTGPKNKLDEYLWGILYRYQLLGSNNHQLAVLPSIMHQMKTDYNLDFECFASSINSMATNYCSIYYDLERHFGSVGSFFNITPLKGTFGFNPPYQKDIITLGCTRLLELLKDSSELSFIITIPIWDTEGRKIMKELYNNELEKQNIDYGDFEIMNTIRQSPFLKKIKMIPKEKFTYLDHNFNLYKNRTIQNTYILVLSNTTKDFNEIDGYNYESSQ